MRKLLVLFLGLSAATAAYAQHNHHRHHYSVLPFIYTVPVPQQPMYTMPPPVYVPPVYFAPSPIIQPNWQTKIYRDPVTKCDGDWYNTPRGREFRSTRCWQE